MKDLTKNLWHLIEQQHAKIAQLDKDFIFEKDKYDEFHDYFKKTYYYIKDRYMSDKVEYLDRHKVAALLVICVLEKKVIYHNATNGRFFIGAELLALRAALAYMLMKLNEKLKPHNEKIEVIEFPEALSCDTKYLEIMCRNLYHAKNDYQLNPLDLAEKLYLLEQYWLLKAKIDPQLLKEVKNP